VTTRPAHAGEHYGIDLYTAEYPFEGEYPHKGEPSDWEFHTDLKIARERAKELWDSGRWTDVVLCTWDRSGGEQEWTDIFQPRYASE